MFAIYENCMNIPFIGVIAETEEKAWEYLDKKYGKEVNLSNGTTILCGCNRDAFVIKKVNFVK